MTGPRRALVISENAPVPADRRVWNVSRSLRDAGWAVHVACAAAPGQAPAEVREGIEIRRYPLRPSGGGAAGYAREYAQAMWRLRRAVRALGREHRFDIVHTCNPPDVLSLAARPLRAAGTRFVFDHHDLVPELYRSRFGRGEDAGFHATLALERLAFRGADVSLATNGSYARIAVERGRMDPNDVFVVRNGPDVTRFTPVAPRAAWRRGAEHLIAYVGVMGPQDGVDHALRALAALRARREDWHAVLVGAGDALPAMRTLAAQLGLGRCVEFAGWREDGDIRSVLSTADVCLAPDPPSPLNDCSTMIKIPEYMAMGRAIASYDLAESRVSAADAALYARPGDHDDLGRCLDRLLGDAELRARLGAAGRARVESALSWQHGERALLAAYDRALAGAPTPYVGREPAMDRARLV